MTATAHEEHAVRTAIDELRFSAVGGLLVVSALRGSGERMQSF